MSGTIDVRMTWTDLSNNPPAFVWVEIDGHAAYNAGTSGSGDCADGLGDQVVPIEGVVGGTSEGKHIYRKKVISGVATFSTTLAATSSADSGDITASANSLAKPSDKSATLARTDGGVITLQDDGTYLAHTLLTWHGNLIEGHQEDGTVIMLNYDELTDGGPGLTRPTLLGRVDGAWQQAMFPDPLNPGQNYTTYDLKITWSGGINPSTDVFQPTNPRSVQETTYSGDMPNFDPAGTGPKDALWNYHVAERSGDKVQPDLNCTWKAHFVAENWSDTGDRSEVERIYGGWIVEAPLTGAQLFTVVDYYGNENLHKVQTRCELPTPSNITFAIRRSHIGVDLFRTYMNEWSPLDFVFGNPQEPYPQPLPVTVSRQDGEIDGIYHTRPFLYASWRKGTLDVRNAKGELTQGNAKIIPYTDWQWDTQTELKAGGS